MGLLYRAVDKEEGNTVDFMLSEHRDEPAAREFFEKAIGQAVFQIKSLWIKVGGLFVQLTMRQIKYLNNIVEQDHRFIKKIRFFILLDI